MERLRLIGIELPIDVQGDVTLRFSVSIPLNGLREGKAYRISGNLSSTSLRVDQLQLANLRTQVDYRNGIARLNNLTTQWSDPRTSRSVSTSPGTLAGNVSMELLPRGNMLFSLGGSNLALQPIHDLVLSVSGAPARPSLQGNVSGSIDGSLPLANFDQPATWLLDADVTATSLVLGRSIPLTVRSGSLSLRDGRVTTTKFRVESTRDREAVLTGELDAMLTGDRRFEFALQGNDFPIKSLASLVSLEETNSFQGTIDLIAAGKGSLGSTGFTDAAWTMTGRFASPRLVLAGVDLGVLQHEFEFDDHRLHLKPLAGRPSEDVLVETIDANYQLTPDAYQLSNLTANLFGGQIAGEVLWMNRDAGSHRIDLEWTQLQPRFSVPLTNSQNISVTLNSSGSIDWTAPVATADPLMTQQGNATIQVHQMRVGAVDVGNANLLLAASAGNVSFNGTGEIFGGEFSVETTTPLAAAIDWLNGLAGPVPNGLKGRVSLDRAELSLISRSLPWKAATDIQGLGSLELVLDPSRSAEARVILEQLAFNRQAIADNVAARVRFNEGLLQVEQFVGRVAGGRLEGTGFYQPSADAGRFYIRLASLDANRALAPIVAIDQSVSGSLSGRLTIELAERLRATGSLDLRGSNVGGKSFGDPHSALLAEASRDFSQWTLRFDPLQTTLGTGTVTGAARLSQSSRGSQGFDLQSQWQAGNADYSTLTQRSGRIASYAEGKLTGRLYLDGRGIRSASDLYGQFSADLSGSRASAIPGLLSAQQFLSAYSIAGTQFNAGKLRGSIAGGTANINEFWLASDKVQVVAVGRVRLTDARVDLTATISTGNFDVQNLVIENLAQQVALAASPPVLAVLEANRLLSNRTLVVDFVGPFNDPRVYLRPAQNLQRGISRYLIRQGVGTVLLNDTTR